MINRVPYIVYGKNKYARKIVVIDGQAYYQSTGANSDLMGMCLPCEGVQVEDAYIEHEPVKAGWLIKKEKPREGEHSFKDKANYNHRVPTLEDLITAWRLNPDFYLKKPSLNSGKRKTNKEFNVKYKNEFDNRDDINQAVVTVLCNGDKDTFIEKYSIDLMDDPEFVVDEMTPENFAKINTWIHNQKQLQTTQKNDSIKEIIRQHANQNWCNILKTKKNSLITLDIEINVKDLLSKTLDGINRYQQRFDQNGKSEHLTLFSTIFEPYRGKNRAACCENLVKSAFNHFVEWGNYRRSSEFDCLCLIRLLLSGNDGKVLQKDIAVSMGFATIESAKNYLDNKIKNIFFHEHHRELNANEKSLLNHIFEESVHVLNRGNKSVSAKELEPFKLKPGQLSNYRQLYDVDIGFWNALMKPLHEQRCSEQMGI